MVFIGLCGKPNCGKSTLFSALTLANVDIADYPFTTIDPNKGMAYIKTDCPCTKLQIKCNPQNSKCINGVRFVPINIIDVAGLVPEAHQGKGLGNKFLSDLAQADCLIQVIDSSGKTNLEGKPGILDPKEEILFLELEIVYWIKSILQRNWNKIKGREILVIIEILNGLKIDKLDIEYTARELNLNVKNINWTDEELLLFSSKLREKSKPIIIAANKTDILESKDNIKRLKEIFPNKIIIPICAVAELALKKANENGIIDYIPGDTTFIIKKVDIKKEQLEGLNKIKQLIKEKGTGVQDLINTAVFDFLNMVVVYPVEDENKLTNNKGQVLPDAILLKQGSTAQDLAFSIHTDIGKNFIRAIDVRTKKIIGKDHVLKHNDIIKIIAKT